MTIATSGSIFIAADKVDGAGAYNWKPLLARMRMPGADGTNFLIGTGNTTNFNNQAQTFDLSFQASFLYPALQNQSGGATPALGPNTLLASTTGLAGNDAQYSFNSAVRNGDGGYIAGINTGSSILNTTFSLKYVNSKGDVYQTIDPAPANGHPKFLNGMTRLNSGATLVTWTDIEVIGGVPTDANIYSAILNDAGVVTTPAFLVNTSTINGYAAGDTILTGNGAVSIFSQVVPGGAVESGQLLARRYDNNGVLLGSDIVIADTFATNRNIENAETKSLGNGGFAVFWLEKTPFPAAPGASNTIDWSYKVAFFTETSTTPVVSTILNGSMVLDAAKNYVSGTVPPQMDTTDLANGGAALILTPYTGPFTFGAPLAFKYTMAGSYIGTTSGGFPVGEGFGAVVSGVGNYELAEDGRVLEVVSDANDVLGQYWNFNANSIGGTAGNDIFYGDAGVDDSISGGDGNDTLIGLSGFDFLQGGLGNDLLIGNNDDDTADYSNATLSVTVTLTDNVDANGDFLGTATGGHGNDTLVSIERLRGGSANDILIGNSQSNILRGNAGDDIIDGGAGSDTADYSNQINTAPVVVILTDSTDLSGKRIGTATGAGNDTLLDIEGIFGGAGNDTLSGNSLDNTIRGNAGNDTINGGAGNDTVDYRNASAGVTVALTDGLPGSTGGSSSGADGIDTLINIERIRGSRFNDILIGNSFSNTLRGMEGNDILDGGAGFDFASYTDAQGSVFVTLTDAINGITGGSAAGAGGIDTLFNIESLIGSDFDDILTGNNNNNFLRGGTGADILNGGGQQPGSIFNRFGGDWADYLAAETGVTANLANAAVNTGEAAGDTYISVESLRGSLFNDTLTGDGVQNQLRGNLGNDAIDGAGGFDYADYFEATGGVTVTLTDGSGGHTGGTSTGADGNDTLTDIEGIVGSFFNDILTGNSSANTIVGEAGNDTIDGGAGNDTASYIDAAAAVTVVLGSGPASGSATGGAGTDTLTSIENIIGSEYNDILTGNELDNVISGRGGDDSITGGDGNDTLQGGDGADKLQGGAGNDMLDGGDDRDTAIYLDATGPVSIDLASGIVTGAGIGTDTLRAVETVRGSAFNDTFVATGFGAGSLNASSLGTTNNTFEGGGGNDAITGNGATQISFFHATGGVTVDLNLGTASGDASVGTDTFSSVTFVRGSEFNDTLFGSNLTIGFEQFNGGAGNDLIDGRGGFDRASYSNFVDDTVTAGVNIQLAAGTVTGDVSVGVDTLRSIESVRGSKFADVFDATGFTAASVNAGSAGTNGTGAAFSEFEGMGGNDTVTGNGNTRLAFYNADAGVTADISAGTSASRGAGDSANVGNDTFSGIISLAGSNFDDLFFGSANANQTLEQFEGRAGNDTLDGRGGFDQAVYSQDTAVTAGITVNMAAGTVTGDAATGIDTLIAIESVRGTNFADIFNSVGFSGASTDTGLQATFNEFEGMGGNDTITGNGNARVSYVSASGAVTVDIQAGTAIGNASVGTDTFTGVRRVRGSNFNDTLSGANSNDIFEGQNGNDVLDGRTGDDSLTGGNGNDRFVYSAGYGVDTITDFQAGQGDIIDLRGLPVYSIANVQMVGVQNGANTVLTFSAGNSLTLNNVTLTNLVAGNFMFDPVPSIVGDGTDNFLIGTINGELIQGLGGNDKLQGGPGNDTLDGGAGNDKADYSETTGGVTVTLTNLSGGHTGGASSGAAGDDILIDIENIVGGTGNDVMTGNDQDNSFAGDLGNDTITGGGGNDFLFGGDGNDVLAGGVGNDSLFGENGDDQLIGAAGADSIDGGAGNDSITFDVDDISVLGGIGTDTAIFAGGTTAQARAIDVSAASIEVLQWVVNGNTYTIVPTAGGTRTETVTDTANSEISFQQRMTLVNAAAQEELVDTQRDDGTRQVYDYDPTNAQAWSSILQVYAVGGALDFTDTNYDNNSRVVRDEDQGNLNGWSYITTTYSPSSAVDYQDSNYDDGSRVIFDGDQDAAFNWTSISTTYANGGAVDYQDYIYDNGTRVIFDADQAAATSWATRTTSYAAGNILDVQDTIYDDNSRVIYDWDNANAFYWATFESFYNTSGVLTTQRVTRDNGQIDIYNI